MKNTPAPADLPLPAQVGYACKYERVDESDTAPTVAGHLYGMGILDELDELDVETIETTLEARR